MNRMTSDRSILGAEVAIRQALGVLAVADKIKSICYEIQYDGHNDEYFERSEWTMQFAGTHTDEELDYIPAVRRLERSFDATDGVTNIRFHDGARRYNIPQEQVALVVTRSAAQLDLFDQDGGASRDWPHRRIRWKITDGILAAARQYYVGEAPKGGSAHDLLAMNVDTDMALASLGLAAIWNGDATPVAVNRATSNDAQIEIEISPRTSIMAISIDDDEDQD
jgi:hypothetical protein